MRFLFLQGGYSSFFNRVGDGLLARGHSVVGINFCAGDQWLWRRKQTVNYRGRLSDWPAFIENFLEQRKITDVILLGEQRDYHKQAVEAAKRLGIRVVATDFGYLRPDWLTLERDGMGGNSHFPREPGELLDYARDMPPLEREVKYTDRFWDMAVGDLVYSFANVFFWFLFPRYRRSDHRAHPLRYFPALGWRLLFAGRRNRRADRVLSELQEWGGEYFLFPMQLEHDFQIQAYSPFDTMDEAVLATLNSFAQNAPVGTRLLFKVHPWDPGFKNWTRRIEAWAYARGLAERVVIVDGGALEKMITFAKGLVTVNSTSAIQALRAGCPVVCLGKAIFDTPGLSHQKGLDSFWVDPSRPKERLFDAFERLLAGTIQFRGVFYSEPGLTAAVEEAVRCLAAPNEYAAPWHQGASSAAERESL